MNDLTKISTQIIQTYTELQINLYIVIYAKQGFNLAEILKIVCMLIYLCLLVVDFSKQAERIINYHLPSAQLILVRRTIYLN